MGCSRTLDRRRDTVYVRAIEIGAGLLAAVLLLLIATAPWRLDRLPDQRIVIRVEREQTLWDIAAEHPLPGRSTAETVAAIKEANGLSTADLSVGQRLEVPLVGDDVFFASR